MLDKNEWEENVRTGTGKGMGTGFGKKVVNLALVDMLTQELCVLEELLASAKGTPQEPEVKAWLTQAIKDLNVVLEGK